jgi:hypothetical protein
MRQSPRVLMVVFRPNHQLKLTGAAISLFRGIESLQAAPAT